MAKDLWLRGLLRDHEGQLLRFAKRRLSDAEARDVVQECFLRLWKEDSEKILGFEAAWLFCVCRNLAFDRLKAEAKMTSDDFDPSQIASSELGADERIQQTEQEYQMNQLLKSLNESQQEVIRLKFQDGFSYKEISKITGHSVSHVGVLIHEAMKRLKLAGGAL